MIGEKKVLPCRPLTHRRVGVRSVGGVVAEVQAMVAAVAVVEGVSAPLARGGAEDGVDGLVPPHCLLAHRHVVHERTPTRVSHQEERDGGRKIQGLGDGG